MKFRVWIVIISYIALFSMGYSSTYYIDKNHNNASDNNPGTEAQPFLTIWKGVGIAEPGDVIIVKAGVYEEGVTFSKSGNPGNYIKLIAYNQDKVVLDGSNLGNKRGISIGSYWPEQIFAAYIWIENIEIRNFAYDGIRAIISSKGLGAHHLVLKGLHIHHNGLRGIYIYPDEVGEIDPNGYGQHVQAGYHLLEDCLVEYNQRHGIKIGGTDIIVRNCVSHHNNPTGEFKGTGYGLQISGSNWNITVEGGAYYNNYDYGITVRAQGSNVLKNVTCYDNRGTGIQVTSLAENVILDGITSYHNEREGIKINDYAKSVNVMNCKIYENDWYGIRLTGKATDVTLKNNEVYSNVLSGIRLMKKSDINGKCNHVSIQKNYVYNNNDCGISIYNSTDIQINQNTLYNNQYQTGEIYVYSDVENVVVKNNILKDLWIENVNEVSSDYNCFYKSGSQKIVYMDTRWEDMPDLNNIYNQENHSIQASPNFMDISQNDFTLQSNSPCIGKGENKSTIGAWQVVNTGAKPLPPNSLKVQ